MKKGKPFLYLAVALFLSVACSLTGGGGGEGQQTPLPPGSGTPVTQEGGGQPPQDEGAPQVDEDALAGLDSYRARIEWEWAPVDGETEHMRIEEEATRDPSAQRYVLYADEEEPTEWIQIGDTTWMCGPEGDCIQMTMDAGAALFGEGMLDAFTLYSGAEEYEFIGQEMVNGINSRHYRLNLSTLVEELISQSDVSDMEADAWVADDPSLPTFVVRFTMFVEAEGEDAGEWTYSWEIYDVNAPITIEPPEDVAGMPEDLPEYPNAQDMMVMGTMVMFTTPDDVDAVAEFYSTGLSELGWTLDSDESMSGMVLQVWTREGSSLQVMISPGDGETSVTLILEE